MASKKTQAADPLGLLPKSMSADSTREREEKTKAARAGLPEVEMGMDDLDKMIDQKWGSDEDYLTAKDPMLDCVNRFKAEYGAAASGLSFKFFTPLIAGEIGMEGYEKCLDKQGNAYMVGPDFMGMIPTRIAEKRKQKALKESEDAVADSQSRLEEGAERVRHDAGSVGVEVTGGLSLGSSVYAERL